MQPEKFRPLPGYLIGEPIKEENKTDTGIYVVDDGPTKVLRVVAVNAQESSGLNNLAEICVGSHVVYAESGMVQPLTASGMLVVPLSSVLAVHEQKPAGPDGTKFLKQPDWPDFKTNDYEKIWKPWENIRSFTFRINFLEPFHPISNATAKIFHDSLADTLRPKVDTGDYFQFEGKKNSDGNDDNLIFTCGDDFYAGNIALSKSNSLLHFQKPTASIQNLVETLPTWFSAIHRFINTSNFRELAGREHERITSATFQIRQIIRLQGKGSYDEPVKNSETMGHFVKFGTIGTEPISPTLEPLALDAAAALSESLGRVDLKFSYRCPIGGREYGVFLTIEAPANEDSRLLFIYWEFQDHAPGYLPDREYGPILTEYFRDKVLRGFYKAWLDGYSSTSLSGYGHAES